MKSIYYWFVLIVSIAVLVSSCSSEEDSKTASTDNTTSSSGDPDSGDSSSTTELEGTWTTSCVSSGSRYKIRTLTVSGTNVTVDRWEFHSDSSCANDAYRFDTTYSSLSIGDAMTFDTYGSSGGTGHKLTMTVDTNTYTPLIASDVTWSNDNSWCGETDWVLNTAQSIAGKTCGSEDHWNTNITIYGLYLLDGNKLFLNYSSSSYPSGVDAGDNDTLTKQSTSTSDNSSSSSIPSCSTYESGNAVDTAGSGTITLGNKNVSGTYSNSWKGVTPIGGCIDNSSALSSWSDSVPSGTGSFKHKFIVTSNSSHTIADYWYSDSNCSTSIGYTYKNYNSITVGDNTTGLNENLSRPSYGYEVDKTYSSVTVKGITDNATTLLNSWFSDYCTVTKGVEYNVPAGQTVYKAYWNTADSGNTDWFWMSRKGTSGYSDWSDNDNWYYPDSWQLIARQVDSDNFTDGTHELFSSNASNTFLENDNDPSSSTFMSIGNLNKSYYADNGTYKFKLVWDGLQVDNLTIKEVIWTQTSWLENSPTQGFQEIGDSGFNTGADSNTDFVGLAKSTESNCVFDGDGGTVSDRWWNCVGVASLHTYNGSDGMPGPLQKVASSMHLYIWAPSGSSFQMGGAIQGTKLSLSTAVTTLAGSDNGSTNATGTSASFSEPYGITTDGTNLYVSDSGNHRIRKIVIDNGTVTTLAGSSSGSTDATGTSASFSFPTGITTDGTNLYVTDHGNHRIRKIVIDNGTVTTLAGSSSGNIDATGTSASFSYPTGITTDGTNLYVSDQSNQWIRKIVISTGVVTTLAGSSSGSTDATGTSASFNYPIGITTDGTNLYVADQSNHRIRKIE